MRIRQFLKNEWSNVHVDPPLPPQKKKIYKMIKSIIYQMYLNDNIDVLLKTLSLCLSLSSASITILWRQKFLWFVCPFSWEKNFTWKELASELFKMWRVWENSFAWSTCRGKTVMKYSNNVIFASIYYGAKNIFVLGSHRHVSLIFIL